jgi:hypothetical protein
MAFWRGLPWPQSRLSAPRGLGQLRICNPGSYGRKVGGDRTQVLLVDLGGVLFSLTTSTG